MTWEEHLKQLRRAQSCIPKILTDAAENATLRAVEAAAEKTPPTLDDLSDTNTRTGELKQHWATDSTTKPTRQGNEYVTELANDKEYASYVNDGHRMDKHFVPGLYANPYTGQLEYDPGRRGEVGIMVGTKTTYVPGVYMTDAAEKAYEDTLRAELVPAWEELLK